MSSGWKRLRALAAPWVCAMASAVMWAMSAPVQAQAGPGWNPKSGHPVSACWTPAGRGLPAKVWGDATGKGLDLAAVLVEAGLYAAKLNDAVPPNCHMTWVSGPTPRLTVEPGTIGGSASSFYVDGSWSFDDRGSCPGPGPFEGAVYAAGCVCSSSGNAANVGFGADAQCY